MWLARLDLLAFGRFTDVRLTLGPGFHLIYGPNEAGKSTTLRAIRQLLFGFDERTTDNFVHQNANLRIGGIVCDQSGIEQEVIRRKTRKDSLLTPGETSVIDDDLWRTLLCGVDEDTFSRRYGIDYEQLVEGGREIATGTGDLGEILFATGSGVMDLTAVQKRLTEEAGELFRPQGKKQRLNLAIVEWQRLRDLVNEKLLPAADWEKVDRQRHETLARLDEISKQLTQQTSQADLHRRWQKAWPLIQEGDALEQQLRPLESVRRLPTSFGPQRQEAQLLLSHANTQEQAAQATLTSIEQHIQRLAISDEMLAEADELTRLLTEWGSYSKAQLDRPNLVEQHAQLLKRIADLLQGLGRPPDESDVYEIVVDRVQRTRIGQLGRQQASLDQALQQTKSRSQRIGKQIEELHNQLSAIPAIRPLDELRRVVKLTRADGQLESQLAKIRDEMTALHHERTLQFERLGIWSGSLADLRKMQIPSFDVVKHREAEFEAHQTEQKVLQSRLKELIAEHQALSLQIEVFRREFLVPTEIELELARTDRDQIWSRIREAISSNVFPVDSLIAAYEQSLKQTDQLADRLRREADRVAQLSEQSAELTANEARQQEVNVRLAELETNRVALEERWQADWQDLGSSPLPPREMQTWLSRRDLLLQNDVQLERRSAEANELAIQIDLRFATLSSLMFSPPTDPKTANVDRSSKRTKVKADTARSDQEVQQQLSFGWGQEAEPLTPSKQETEPAAPSEVVPTLGELLQRADDQLEHDEAIQRGRVDCEEAIARLTVERCEAEQEAKRIAGELEQWTTEWRARMAELKLPPDSSPDTVASFVETLSELKEYQRQAAQLQERIRGIDGDAEAFRANVKTLCHKIAPDLIELPIGDAVKSLRARLSATQKDQVVLNELTARQRHCEEQRTLAIESRVRGEGLINQLCQFANVSGKKKDSQEISSVNEFNTILEQLASIEEQSQRRSVIEEKIARIRERLIELAKEIALDEFLDQVKTLSPESIAARLLEFDHKCRQLTADRDQLNRQLGGFDELLQQMDGSAEAAEAEEKQRQCLAQIRSDAEQYIRMKLAGSVLHSAVERYREKIRGPVLAIASQIFQELTLESFVGLRVDEDEKGNPILVGIRTGGREIVKVDGMSEGTCDQLYLALRLASLQLESAPQSHLPFIVDDILIQFDDARSAAALKVLSKLGTQRQVIFFTHHEHLLDVAQRHLPGGFTTHRLAVDTPATSNA